MIYLSNTESLDEDFDELRKAIFQFGSQTATFAEKIPLKWIRLEQSLDIIRDAGKNILSFEDVTKLSVKCDIRNQREVNLFLKYQHNIGNIVYFETLNEYIILSQKWLADAFKCLVSDKFDGTIQLSDEWHILESRGELHPDLISRLFEKEPGLQFNKFQDHLLNVMEQFDILYKPNVRSLDNTIQQVSNYYMPCMVNAAPSLENILKMFNVKPEIRTPWLCFTFDFLPVSFFNHILFYFLRNYTVCSGRLNDFDQLAIFHGKGVFYLDLKRFQRLIICFSKNTISVQLWEWRKVTQGKYKDILTTLKKEIKRLRNKFQLNVSYVIKMKCPEGNVDNPAGSKTYQELLELGEEDYFCEDHNTIHPSLRASQTWFEDYEEVKLLINCSLFVVICSRLLITLYVYTIALRNIISFLQSWGYRTVAGDLMGNFLKILSEASGIV